jgi:hypothetical protein
LLRLRLKSGAILRDDDREYLANQVMEDDGPDEIDHVLDNLQKKKRDKRNRMLILLMMLDS